MPPSVLSARKIGSINIEDMIIPPQNQNQRTKRLRVDEVASVEILQLNPRFHFFAWMAGNALEGKTDERTFLRIWDAVRRMVDTNMGLPMSDVCHVRQRVETPEGEEVTLNARFLQTAADNFLLVHSGKNPAKRTALVKEVKAEVLDFLRVTGRGMPADAIPYSHLPTVLGCTPYEMTLLYAASEMNEFFEQGEVLQFGTFAMQNPMTQFKVASRHWAGLASLLGTTANVLEHELRQGSLMRLKLLEINDSGPLPLSAKNGKRAFLSFNPALMAMMTGSTGTTLEQFVSLLRGRLVLPEPGLGWEDFAHLGESAEIAAEFLANPAARGGILLVGPPGCGKTEFAAQVCARANRPCHAAGERTEFAVGSDDPQSDDNPDRNYRIASLRLVSEMNTQAAILLDEAEDVLREPSGATDRFFYSKMDLNRLLENLPVPVIWTTNSLMGMDPATLRRMAMVVVFARPDAEVRERIWNRVLTRTPIEGASPRALAREFDMSPGLFDTAARTIAFTKRDAKSLPTVLDGFARVMGGRADRDDDEPEFDSELCEADADMEALTRRILESPHRDFSMCLYGPPGSGKSAFARHLAKRMEMKWTLKRASDLLDKYVGGSEKLIAEAFAEARIDRRVLIIDEADSMLASRDGATRSWEVTQVNEMLTQMESHDLPFFVTTNLMDKLDKASLRRFTFKLGFRNLPPSKLRLAFRRILGVEVPEGAGMPDNLSAGDVAGLRKRARIMGENDPTVLLGWLRDEAELKEGGRKNPLGFGG